MNPICPGCGLAAPESASVCHHCGRTLRPAASSESQRRLLSEFHLRLRGAIAGAGTPGSAEQACELFLRNGFIPDDYDLLKSEADRCLREVDGATDISGIWWIRYQACVVKLDRREAQRSERAARDQRAARAAAAEAEARRRMQVRLMQTAVALTAILVLALALAVGRHFLLLRAG